jgi:hypothetical protein
MKRRVWKWALAVAALVALAIGGLLWSAHSRATEAFQRHDRRVKDIFAAIRARPGVRHPLGEPALPGNAWAGYEDAMKRFDMIPDADLEEFTAFQDDENQGRVNDREKAGMIFERYAGLVEDLRRSVRHESFLPDYPYEEGLNMDVGVQARIRAAKFLAERAVFLHQDVREADALEVLQVGLAASHDAARGGPILSFLVMLVGEGIHVSTLRELMGGHSFEAADLAALARTLDRMAAARPGIAQAYEAEEVALCRTLIDVAITPGFEQTQVYSERSWRFLFSHRLAYAGALGDLERMFREARSVAGLATHLRSAAMERACSPERIGRNPVTRSLIPALSRVYLRDAVGQMNWTLMRVATAIAWYEAERGRVPERLEDLVPRYLPVVPACPFTGLPLGYRDGTLWSAGHNRIDEGGTPGTDNDPDAIDGDVVWQVRRE